jgi:hypothetical protein
MKMNVRRFAALPVLWAAVIALPLAATATDLRIKAQLAWGTDDSKPPGKELHELDPKLREKFRHLRWKNYFLVKAQTTAIAPKAVQKVVLSDKCSLALRDVGDGNLEIRIFGVNPGGQPALLKTESCPIEKLKAGHIFAFAGDTKEKWDDAWLVIVTSAE